jgi:nitrogen fixation NifU-like protein
MPAPAPEAGHRPTPYSSTITEHFRRPRNQGTLADADASAEGANPLCGDRVRVELALDRDPAAGRETSERRIAEARFTANACAICVASASLLTERLRGLSLAEAALLKDADAVAALDAEIPAARQRCATLPLEAARRAVAAIAAA